MMEAVPISEYSLTLMKGYLPQMQGSIFAMNRGEDVHNMIVEHDWPPLKSTITILLSSISTVVVHSKEIWPFVDCHFWLDRKAETHFTRPPVEHRRLMA